MQHQTRTFPLGSGQWKLVVLDMEGNEIIAFVGSNGMRDEPADDLWNEYDMWRDENGY